MNSAASMSVTLKPPDAASRNRCGDTGESAAGLRRLIETESLPSGPRGDVYAIFRPAAANRLKSATFGVAMGAPSARAAAPIMQSMIIPRRRPESLNRRAATTAWSGVKSRRRSTNRSASSTSPTSSGPHRNSVHATELMMSASPSPTHLRSLTSFRRSRNESANEKARIQVNHRGSEPSRRPAARRSDSMSSAHCFPSTLRERNDA